MITIRYVDPTNVYTRPDAIWNLNLLEGMRMTDDLDPTTDTEADDDIPQDEQPIGPEDE